MSTVLVTGGAGFIGSHLADELLRGGYRVRALDNLSAQVHGAQGGRPDYLSPEVELVVGDVRDREIVRRALQGVDAVFHLAAAVGVGQSMYEVAQYTAVNNLGTAVLLEALIETPVRRLVVASSMSLYGEGLYRAADGTIAAGVDRTSEQLARGEWEVCDARGVPLTPIATPETKPPVISSVYALGKFDQERLCLMIGRAYGIETVALRFFNVYGTRQALSNPYTGALAIFSAQLLNGRRPLLFEDGRQQRDLVSVHDIARACRLALEVPDAAGQVFNVGSGHPTTIAELARGIAAVIGRPDLPPNVTGEYRAGDIRHCFADITRAREVLGYLPTVTLDAGLREFAGWLDGQVAIDNVPLAMAELTRRGLAVAARS
jgi:dTDP-L-rhamnose 4-epimerase